MAGDSLRWRGRPAGQPAGSQRGASGQGLGLARTRPRSRLRARSLRARGGPTRPARDASIVAGAYTKRLGFALYTGGNGSVNQYQRETPEGPFISPKRL